MQTKTDFRLQLAGNAFAAGYTWTYCSNVEHHEASSVGKHAMLAGSHEDHAKISYLGWPLYRLHLNVLLKSRAQRSQLGKHAMLADHRRRSRKNLVLRLTTTGYTWRYCSKVEHHEASLVSTQCLLTTRGDHTKISYLGPRDLDWPKSGRWSHRPITRVTNARENVHSFPSSWTWYITDQSRTIQSVHNAKTCFKRLKEGIEERVDTHAGALAWLSTVCWCPFTNF